MSDVFLLKKQYNPSPLSTACINILTNLYLKNGRSKIKMLRKIVEKNKLLLGLAVLQEGASRVEKLTTTNEKSVGNRLNESANNKILGFEKNVEGQEISKIKDTNNKLDAPKTGWEHVKKAFQTDGDKFSPELHFTLFMAMWGFIGGFIYGGMKEYIKAASVFLYGNDTENYLSKNEAKKTLIRTSLTAFNKGALLKAPKIGILCGSFGALISAANTYTGKCGSPEFTFAGAVTGALMKWNLGIRGMISGCVTGGLSGLILGTTLSVFLPNNGMSDVQVAVFNFHYLTKEKSRSKERSARMSDIERYCTEKTDGLTVFLSDD